MPLLYRELVDTYRLIDPCADHAEEAASFAQAFESAVSPRAETLLDIGAGAGHNAYHLKGRFRCTLTDISEQMLDLSRELNPECEHFAGDMRTLRLGRTFDAVLVHDAVMYATTVEDLSAVVATAFAHTRSGGAAVFAPDAIRETFREQTELIAGEEGTRAVRCIEWSWDPDPSDDTTITEYVFVLRDGLNVRTVHDRHIEGLFSSATWHRVLGAAGFEVATFERPIGDGEVDRIFLCRRP